MASELQTACCEEIGPVRKAGVMDQLQNRKNKAIQELEEIEKAIALFKQHPEFEQALTQLSRVGIYR